MKIDANIRHIGSKELVKNITGRDPRIDPQLRIPIRDNFFANLELTHISNTLYKTKEEEFVGAQIFTQTNDWEAGARQIGYDLMEPVGAARVGSQGSNANDIPFVNEKLTENIQNAVELEIGIRYTRQEIEAAETVNRIGRGANLRLVTERATTARRAISRMFDQGIWQGFSQYNMSGLQDIIPAARQGSLPTDNNTVAFEEVQTGVGGKLWSQKTGQEIIKDLVRGKINGVERGKIFRGTDLIVDSAAYKFLLDPYSDLSGRSIMSYINDAGLFQKVWVTNSVSIANNGSKVSGVSTGNTYFVICDSAQENAEIPILRPPTVYPAVEDFTQMVKQLVAMRYAGLLVKYPAAFYFADGHIEAATTVNY